MCKCYAFVGKEYHGLVGKGYHGLVGKGWHTLMGKGYNVLYYHALKHTLHCVLVDGRCHILAGKV